MKDIPRNLIKCIVRSFKGRLGDGGSEMEEGRREDDTHTL
jgi:hypothetical protein